MYNPQKSDLPDETGSADGAATRKWASQWGGWSLVGVQPHAEAEHGGGGQLGVGQDERHERRQRTLGTCSAPQGPNSGSEPSNRGWMFAANFGAR